MNNRKVICAGCQLQYLTSDTVKYRKKRCCGNESCYSIIDAKVTHFNYRKQQKKLANGTYRHGVPIPLKLEIIKRDENTCRLCLKQCADNTSQVHHIIPVSAGGEDEAKNLVVLCSDCHVYVHKTDWKQFQNDFEFYAASAELANPTVVHSKLGRS